MVKVTRKHRIDFSNIHPKVKNVMQMNGFRKYFSWERVTDKFHSTIEYRIFQATTQNLEEFEKYLLINVFNRADMPTMSVNVKNRIIDSFLEMFNNVLDHANSKCVYVCGQYFHKNGKLIISIVDEGKTIKENVGEYLEKLEEINSLEWAIVPGNSTKSNSAPGGLGFSILLEFLKLNKGNFTLISDNESYEVSNKGSRFISLNGNFPGTIVSITFNLHDDFSYILREEKSDDIIF